jgi:twitching motility protein PilU
VEVSQLLASMVEYEASDLYIMADRSPTFRVNGNLRPTESAPLTSKECQDLAYSILTDKQRAEFESEHELNIAIFYEKLGRFRVNILRQRNSVAVVIRRIKKQIPTLEELELPDVLKRVVMTKRGLVLVVGATGAGKSTTLAAMIDYRNSNDASHIITVEDPVEFVHSHKRSIVTQREVGLDTHTYHSALKNCLRQAPDVILLGEIRDTETMECAIQFAETGHLCLATLHSNNADQAMERVMNFFPAERHNQIYMQLSLNLRAVISQRLVRATTGGRSAAFEILLDSPRVKDLIHKGETHLIKETIEKSANLGMVSFDQSLFELYRSGKITLEDALKNADSANNLRLRVKLANDGEEKENIPRPPAKGTPTSEDEKNKETPKASEKPPNKGRFFKEEDFKLDG